MKEPISEAHRPIRAWACRGLHGWACERVSEGSDGSLDTKNPDEFNMVYLSVHVCVIENVCMSVCL